MKVKVSTIARIGVLIVALANQCLALFGRGSLPFTENMAYQVISLIATIVVAAINCWYNQDVTVLAIIAGKLFSSMKDGKITEEELEEIVQSADAKSSSANDPATSFIINFSNGILTSVKSKVDKKKGK